MVVEGEPDARLGPILASHQLSRRRPEDLTKAEDGPRRCAPLDGAREGRQRKRKPVPTDASEATNKRDEVPRRNKTRGEE